MQLHEPKAANCVEINFGFLQFEVGKSKPFLRKGIEPIKVWDTDPSTVRTIVLSALREHCDK